MISTSSEKITPVDFDIHPLIKDRWSPRSFSTSRVSISTVKRLLEAMRWAPSSMNEQPWEVLVAEKGTSMHDQLAATLSPGNVSWAPNAPLLIVVMARTTFANGATNHSAYYDLGLAVGNLTVEATHQGLSLHQMGGFNRAAVKALINQPENIQPVVIIALGYRDQADRLPEDLQKRELAPRKRKAIEEFARIEMVSN